jgi:hypothetical protein
MMQEQTHQTEVFSYLNKELVEKSQALHVLERKIHMLESNVSNQALDFDQKLVEEKRAARDLTSKLANEVQNQSWFSLHSFDLPATAADLKVMVIPLGSQCEQVGRYENELVDLNNFIARKAHFEKELEDTCTDLLRHHHSAAAHRAALHRIAERRTQIPFPQCSRIRTEITALYTASRPRKVLPGIALVTSPAYFKYSPSRHPRGNQDNQFIQ